MDTIVFIKFLINNKVYIRFGKNLIKENKLNCTIKKVINNHCEHRFVHNNNALNGAFNYESSNEGFDFWNNIDTKYRELNNNKNKDHDRKS